jgi:hypothetical protein
MRYPACSESALTTLSKGRSYQLFGEQWGTPSPFEK